MERDPTLYCLFYGKISEEHNQPRKPQAIATRKGTKNLPQQGRGPHIPGERSLPRPLEKRRNSLLIKAHTVCEPASYSLDRQNPSLKKPVIGLPQHSSNGSPNKFFSAFMIITFWMAIRHHQSTGNAVKKWCTVKKKSLMKSIIDIKTGETSHTNHWSGSSRDYWIAYFWLIIFISDIRLFWCKGP